MAGLTGQDQISQLITLYNQGKLQEALDHGEALLEQFPDVSFTPNLLGAINTRLGRMDQAASSYAKALQIKPDFVDAHYNLGMALKSLGKHEEAIASYERALQIKPDYAEAHYSIANILNGHGKFEEAVSSFKRAVHLKPDYINAHSNLGNVLKELGRMEDAVLSYKRALQINPNYAEIHNNLGNLYLQLENYDDAVFSFNKALQIKPDCAKIHCNLGNCLKDMGRPEEAIVSYNFSLHFQPRNSEVFNNLGVALKDLGRPNEALTNYTKALQLDPDNIGVHYNISCLWLLQGLFEKGWSGYEFRLQMEKNLQVHSSPPWEGESLQEKSLILLSEQGVGDEMMFASCIPELCKNPFKSITLLCTNRLKPLFSRSFPSINVIEKESISLSKLPFDLHCYVGSLPAIFRNNQNQFPHQNSYLVSDTKLTEKWRGRYSTLDEKITIGLSWKAGIESKERKFRSIELSKWKRVLGHKANFIDLQHGEHSDEISNFTKTTGIRLHQWEDADPLKDLDNLAAQITALDLVITVDNATVPMAGSLGVETWTLLPVSSGWRWLLDCEDSPWHPSVRLFRQREAGNWQEVLNRVALALEKFIDDREKEDDEKTLSLH